MQMLLACLALASIILPADERVPISSATVQDANLTRIVDLRLGETTLADACKELAAQVGRKIEVREAIADRRTILSVRHLSARDMLDAVCDLNGLRWDRAADGGYFIDRKESRRPRDFTEMGASLQECLPPDVRRFLGFGIPPEELLLPTPLIRYNFDTPTDRLRYEIARKVDRVANDEGWAFFESLKPGILDGKKFPCGKLSSQQQEMLVRCICLQAFRTLDLAFVGGGLKTYEMRPDLARILLKEDELQILTVQREGARETIHGFGGPVKLPH